MKALLLLGIFLITSSAIPISDDAQAKTLQYDNTSSDNGYYYEYSFETSNGLERSESGILVNKGKPDEHIKVSGSYSYIDKDGEIIEVFYTADENGFRIQDKLIPVSEIDVLSAPLPPGVVATLLG